LDALEYARGKVLIGVILSLGRLKDRRAIGPLIKLFEKELTKTFNYNEDWLVLINTAIAFQNFEDPRTIKPLSKALKFDRSSFPNCGGRCGDLQREALNALGKIYDKRAFDVIVNTLESGGYALKLNSVNVLKSIENRKVLAPLYRALQTNRNNKTLVEALQNAISEVERYAGETCYFCGEDLETRKICMIYKPTNRKICAMCWKDLKREQENPDNRTVFESGWDDENPTAVTSKERSK
jgi:HEAT repeat protein